MRTNKIFVYSIIFIVFLLLISSVSAIVGKLGNGRMLLNAETGDVIDRTIRVINDNDVAVVINMFSSGDLENDTEIIDNNFTLSPGEEKNARFKMYLQKPGSFQNRINVQFTPVGEKNGVGLASQVIVTVTGEALSDEEFIAIKGKTEKSDNKLPSALDNILKNDSNESKITPIQVMLLISTVVLLIVLGILYNAYKKKKNGGKKSGEKKRSKK